MWRAWEVFGPANGVGNESQLIERLARLARRPVGASDVIGCVAVSECAFFEPDAWVDVPPSFNPQNLSGSIIDLEAEEGRRLWTECLDRGSAVAPQLEWVTEAADRQRRGLPQIVVPRLGQGSFRLAVLDAYGGACAVTGEHALPAIEAAHIRPWSSGGTHELPNGLPLRRDLHRLFDLGYVSARPDGELPFLAAQHPYVHRRICQGLLLATRKEMQLVAGLIDVGGMAPPLCQARVRRFSLEDY